MLCCRGFFQQIVVAYEFLERKGVPNHGPKLCNVLLDSCQPPRVKVTDVGCVASSALLSQAHRLETTTLVCGVALPL